MEVKLPPTYKAGPDPSSNETSAVTFPSGTPLAPNVGSQFNVQPGPALGANDDPRAKRDATALEGELGTPTFVMLARETCANVSVSEVNESFAKRSDADAVLEVECDAIAVRATELEGIAVVWKLAPCAGSAKINARTAVLDRTDIP